MNPNVYQVERNGQIHTVKAFSTGCAAVRVHPDLRPISWKVLERFSITKAEKKTLFNGCVTVTQIDIPLSWVKW